MRKILVILFLLFAMSAYTDAQVAFRVVAVSPNYPNVYPRYSTLGQVWNAIKDSASISTGKYFLINLASASENITDFSGGYRDSITSRHPYMRLIQLNSVVGDSLVWADEDQFTILGGILYLNPLTAGDGLYFSSNSYNIATTYPMDIVGDSLTWLYNNTYFFLHPSIHDVRIREAINSGVQFLPDSGISVVTMIPIVVRGDTVRLDYSAPLILFNDSLTLSVDPNAFTVNYGELPSLFLKTDSGMTVPVGGNGVKVTPDWNTIQFNSSGKLTINSAIWGDGLSVNTGIGQVNVETPIVITNDTLRLSYLPQHFELVGSYLALSVDSGLIANTFPVSSTPKVSLDWLTLIFTSAGAIQVNPDIAGIGLAMTSGIINLATNDFAKIEKDTIKVRTSTVLTWYGDSLTDKVKAFTEPYDSMGVPMFTSGKIKRYSGAYVLGGADVVMTGSANASFSSGAKLRAFWEHAGEEMVIQEWDVTTKTWGNSVSIPLISFDNNKWCISVEIWLESQ